MDGFGKKAIRWLATSRFLVSFRKFILGAILTNTNLVIVSYNDPERSKIMSLIKKIKDEGLLISYNEGYQIFMAVKSTAKVNGDIAEVGVYKGGSAKIICEAKGDRTLYLFDTFEGLPGLHEVDNSKQFYKGQFKGIFENVKTYLNKYSNVHFYKGFFPSTAEPIKNKRFSFVNLDVDIYESTQSCLEFFYSKMNKGGVIMSHDYIGVAGVKKAFDKFFKDKPEPIIELSGTQCLIVKC